MNDLGHKSPKEQEEAFIAHPDGGSQATWFRKIRKLKDKRGDIDMARVEQINLVKFHSSDPYTQEQLDRRKELEAERDAADEEDRHSAGRPLAAGNGHQRNGKARAASGNATPLVAIEWEEPAASAPIGSQHGGNTTQ
jgi:hypothetical protein